MLLFQKRFHEGLKDGSITVTFRLWNRPRVKVGGRYRVHPLGVLEVDQVTAVALGDVTQHDVRRAGFETLEAFRQYVRREGEIPPDDLRLIRVEFHHGGDGDRVPLALEDTLTEQDVETIARRLGRFDEAAPRPWTADVLRLISLHPQRRAGDLADLLGREKEDFKADVVKLKRLGLTQSFEVGYELSPRGRAFLKGSGWLERPEAKRRAPRKAAGEKQTAVRKPSAAKKPSAKRPPAPK